MKEEFLKKWSCWFVLDEVYGYEGLRSAMGRELEGLLEAQRKACLEEVIKTTELVGYNKQEWIAIEDAISKARIE